MKLGTALILLIFGGLALAGGWMLGPRPPAPPPAASAAGQLMFPGLAPDLQKASYISLLHGAKTLVLERHGEVWGVQDRGGYPVRPGKVHALLTGLTELRLEEPRTHDLAELGRLGLEDPHQPNANSTLLRVLDTKVQPILEVVVGHKRTRPGGNLPEQVYVRRTGDNQSWLADGTLDVDTDAQNWFDRDIVSIPPDKLRSIDVLRGEQHLAFASSDGKLVLTEPADHPKLDDGRVADIGRALEYLSFSDVKPVAQMPGDALGHTVFVTTDGVSLAADVRKAGDDIWLHLTATGDTPEAKTLAAKLAPWAYQVGSWKLAALVPSLDDLKAAPEPAPDTAPAPAK